VGGVGRAAVNRADPIAIERVELVLDLPGPIELGKGGIEPDQNDDSLLLRDCVVGPRRPKHVHGYFCLNKGRNLRLLFFWKGDHDPSAAPVSIRKRLDHPLAHVPELLLGEIR